MLLSVSNSDAYSFKESLLDLKAVSFLMCQCLSKYDSNLKWHVNLAFNKLAYQIISDAEILFNCEIFTLSLGFLVLSCVFCLVLFLSYKLKQLKGICV